MRKHVASVAAALSLSLSLPALAQDAGTASPELTAKAELRDQKGKKVGDAVLRQAPKGVIIELSLKGVPAGEHAFHIHEVGKCEPPFKTAGGHFNPQGHQHGIQNAKGQHAGDLPNLHVAKNKELKLTVFTESVTLKEGPSTVFDADGSSLMIHVGPDDYASDPAGNAGDRIACGVITR